ncbi:MAG: hypothetical protein M3245_05720, partial [Actinomycetota bacterium]|nr:hypothetical protein [Actinomycetota bacterium]
MKPLGVRVPLGTIIAAAVAGPAVLVPLPALAVTDEAEVFVSAGPAGPMLVVRDGDGDDNTFHLIRRVAGVVEVQDASSPLVPGVGCASTSPHIVRCTDAGLARFDVEAGRGNDFARVTLDLPGTVEGGPGRDHLVAHNDGATLSGGGHADTLVG